jgi:transcriptional regulator with XRE-family HTH domain
VLTASQIRAARGALGWSAQELAESAGLSLRTVLRIEAVDGIPPGRATTLAEIKTALEQAGLEFLQDDGIKGAGVRFSSSTKRVPL